MSDIQLLDIDKIEYDTGNPRIKNALEKYGDKITAERIYFALRSAGEGESGSSGAFAKLRDSIKAGGKAQHPIVVIVENGECKCIDGNTRLAIYRDFLKNNVPGDWGKIPTLLKEDMTQADIETIRIAAHMVPPRDWPAYEKAKYLHELYYQNFMSRDQIVALCGGNKREIEYLIEAYEDMIEFYKNTVNDNEFHIDRFSGFVELQKAGVKKAIFDSGHSLEDFGKWIRDGWIHRLADVRILPKVLRDPEAKNIFLKGGINSVGEANDFLIVKEKQKSGNENLSDASLSQLADNLSHKISSLSFSEVQRLQDAGNEDAQDEVRVLDSLLSHLQSLLQMVRKD